MLLRSHYQSLTGYCNQCSVTATGVPQETMLCLGGDRSSDLPAPPTSLNRITECLPIHLVTRSVDTTSCLYSAAAPWLKEPTRPGCRVSLSYICSLLVFLLAHCFGSVFAPVAGGAATMGHRGTRGRLCELNIVIINSPRHNRQYYNKPNLVPVLRREIKRQN